MARWVAAYEQNAVQIALLADKQAKSSEQLAVSLRILSDTFSNKQDALITELAKRPCIYKQD